MSSRDDRRSRTASGETTLTSLSVRYRRRRSYGPTGQGPPTTWLPAARTSSLQAAVPHRLLVGWRKDERPLPRIGNGLPSEDGAREASPPTGSPPRCSGCAVRTSRSPQSRVRSYSSSGRGTNREFRDRALRPDPSSTVPPFPRACRSRRPASRGREGRFQAPGTDSSSSRRTRILSQERSWSRSRTGYPPRRGTVACTLGRYRGSWSTGRATRPSMFLCP